jgi:hypothetical protein
MVIIFGNAGFEADAGKTAHELSGRWGGSAGGHLGAPRAEIPLAKIQTEIRSHSDITGFVGRNLGGTPPFGLAQGRERVER